MERDLQESMLFGKEDELLRLSFGNNFEKGNYPKPFISHLPRSLRGSGNSLPRVGSRGRRRCQWNALLQSPVTERTTWHLSLRPDRFSSSCWQLSYGIFLTCVSCLRRRELTAAEQRLSVDRHSLPTRNSYISVFHLQFEMKGLSNNRLCLSIENALILLQIFNR